MSSLAPSVSGRRERAILALCVGLLSAFAWFVLWRAEDSAWNFLHPHHLPQIVSLSAMLVFIAGWTVMTVAMMLPTSMPVLMIVNSFAGTRPDRHALVALVMMGYLGVWALFGAFAYLAGLLLYELVFTGTWLQNVKQGAPFVLLLAGAFQFSSLKYRCLDKCRSPFSFVIGRWRGRHQRWNALRLGFEHGLFCVGCCWALMLLMFVVGSGSLVWMFILAVVMAIEKNVSWGRQMSPPVGILLLVWGAALLVTGTFA